MDLKNVMYLSYSILIVNRLCSVTNTRCKPDLFSFFCTIRCEKVEHYRFTMLQSLSFEVVMLIDYNNS